LLLMEAALLLLGSAGSELLDCSSGAVSGMGKTGGSARAAESSAPRSGVPSLSDGGLCGDFFESTVRQIRHWTALTSVWAPWGRGMLRNDLRRLGHVHVLGRFARDGWRGNLSRGRFGGRLGGTIRLACASVLG
jgi:hypothetical protein